MAYKGSMQFPAQQLESTRKLRESVEGGPGSGRHGGIGRVAQKFLDKELKKRGQKDVPDVHHTGRAGESKRKKKKPTWMDDDSEIDRSDSGLTA